MPEVTPAAVFRSEGSEPMQTVELHPASVWDCEECGRENFCRLVRPEFSEADLAELKEDHGVEAHETGEFLTFPETVKCQFCFTEFATEDDLESEL